MLTDRAKSHESTLRCKRAGGNREILNFLRTGVWSWQPLGRCTRVRYTRPEGPPPLDWVGLNYYSRVVMDWRCQVGSPAHEAVVQCYESC